MKYRIHLRHTGRDKPTFGIGPMLVGGWYAGFNIDMGYWFIAVRRKRKGEVKRPLVELDFGKSMQRETRMYKSVNYRRGVQDGAKNVFQMWANEESPYWLTIDLMERYDLTWDKDRDMVVPTKIPE